MVVIEHICHRLWKRTSAPWGSFRTLPRERLMADIAIMSTLSESIAIVAVNGLLYLHQFIYLQDKSLINLLQSFAIETRLVIEWFFTSVSVAIDTGSLYGCLAETVKKTHYSSDCLCGAISYMD